MNGYIRLYNRMTEYDRTEANENNPSATKAYAAWQHQISTGETMGVITMYESAYLEALARESAAKINSPDDGL